MSVWIDSGRLGPDGEPFLFEVDEGTAEHANLLKQGAVVVDAPSAPKKPARGGKKPVADDDEGETLGD